MMAIKALPSPARFSPKGIYAYGYNEIDSTWFTYNIKTEKVVDMKKAGIYEEFKKINISNNIPHTDS